MKTRYLLLALTVGAIGITDTKPWLVTPQPTQLAQAAQIADNSSSQVDFKTAQGVAAKVTVRIRVGQGLGSGVLLGKKGKTYLVLTNAHVVRSQAGITIQTPDGQTHTARRVKDPQVGNFDVALLEFDSTRTYQLAKSDVSSRDDFALFESKPIFAAGFARDANTLKFVSGTVKQLPQEPFVNGSQVGYTTTGDIEQGMSGGPILDNLGNLVGINSTYAYPIRPVYTYADGTKAPPDQVAEYRQVNWGVPIYNLLTRLNPDILYSYKQLPKLHRTVTPSGYMAQLDRKARLVTVRIENSDGNGSGVIVARDGNDYYVLTAEHVIADVDTKNKPLYLNQKIVTHDQRTYKISPSEIKTSGGIDLAVVKFTSTQPYQVATLGNYYLSNRSVVFPGGWPAPQKINSQQWQWQLNPGTISSKEDSEFKVQDKLSFSNGYDLIYSSITYGGMSGGPVFNSAGQVIGIHGKAEGDRASGNILGDSLGISIKTFVALVDLLGINKRDLKIITTEPKRLDSITSVSINLIKNNISVPKNDNDATQWIEYGNQLYRTFQYDKSVAAFDRAIIKGEVLTGNYGKALALWRAEREDLAEVAIAKAIAAVPVDYRANYYYLWKYQHIILKVLKKYDRAFTAIDTAIELQENDLILRNEKAEIFSNQKQYPAAISIYDDLIRRDRSVAYFYRNRGILRSRAGDKQGAIADYNEAIRLNVNFAQVYYSRGIVKSDLGDLQGAVADYNQAIKIDPVYIEAYINRGHAQASAGNKPAAIADLNKAIEIDPKSALAYYNRGTIELEQKDTKGAMADFDRAIKLNPKFVQAYINRGKTKSVLGDKMGAIADYDRAIQISPDDALAYYNRGIVKAELKDFNSAIEDYTRAIKIAPDDADAYLKRGQARSALKDVSGEIADYTQAIKIKSNYPLAYLNRGIAKAKLGDTKGTIADCTEAIKLNPDLGLAYLIRGKTKDELGDKQGAIADYTQVIRINPSIAQTYMLRGMTKYEIGDKQGAISDYDRAIIINPQDDKAYYNRGMAKAELGDKKGAIEDLKIAAQILKSQNSIALYEKVMSSIQELSK